jgi:hypothetical protein
MYGCQDRYLHEPFIYQSLSNQILKAENGTAWIKLSTDFFHESLQQFEINRNYAACLKIVLQHSNLGYLEVKR